MASNAGRGRTPAWYRNIQAEPAVEVQQGERRWEAIARTATGEERERLWAMAVAGYPGYAVYRDRTRRTIPVVVLEPR